MQSIYVYVVLVLWFRADDLAEVSNDHANEHIARVFIDPDALVYVVTLLVPWFRVGCFDCFSITVKETSVSIDPNILDICFYDSCSLM